MKERTRQLIGCKSKDAAKRIHKNLTSSSWAMDYDLVWLCYYRCPETGDVDVRPLVIIDYKKSVNEKLGFAHVTAYNYEISQGKRVFIIAGNIEFPPTESDPYYISEFLGGNYKPRPPVYEAPQVEVCKSLVEYQAWQDKVRSTFVRPNLKPR